MTLSIKGSLTQYSVIFLKIKRAFEKWKKISFKSNVTLVSISWAMQS